MLDGALILIELKRNKTPREVVAQAIDYATFVEGLESDRSDPAETQTNATLTPAREKEPWNGEVYASFGHDEKGRLWSEARQYGFISAGGGTWYSNSLNLLNPGDRIWVKARVTDLSALAG